MYVIITASDMETSLVPMSSPISKTLVPINNKPVLQYILDELYSYQGFIDEIVIVKRDVSDIVEYLNLHIQDNFFLTKIHCINGNDYKATLNPSYTILDDFYSGMEHLVDDIKVCPSEVLLWSADELVFDSRKLTDMTTGSFACMYKKSPVKIYRFDEFAHVVNTLITLKRDQNLHTMSDFINLYSQYDSLTILEDFGDYKVWQDKSSYYNLRSELLANNSYNSVNIEIDQKKQQLTKTNKYSLLDYSYKNEEVSRRVQYNLWSEGYFLENANQEQKIFLPEFIEKGINKRGDYCDFVTEEYIASTSLEELLLNENVTEENWSIIFNKLVDVIQNTFHINDIEDNDELYHSYLPKHRREQYISDFEESFNIMIDDLSNEFSDDYISTNYYKLCNNDIAEWKMFFDKFISMYKKNINKDTLIYNHTCERLVHSNLSLDNILYDTFTDTLKFINPRTRKYDIVDKWVDFAKLYMCLYTGYTAIKNKKFLSADTTITIPETLYHRMDMCVNILDDIFEEDSKFLKMYGLVCLLQEIYYGKFSGLDKETRVALLKYASQVRKSLYYSML